MLGHVNGNDVFVMMKYRIARLILVLLALALVGCGDRAPLPPLTAAGPSFTFFVVADTHYGLSQWSDNEAANKAAIDQMNCLPGTPCPLDMGDSTVETPIAVLVAGDLTDSGEYFNWFGYRLLHRHDGFRDDYAMDGKGRLKYPVLEAYGNHDIAEQRTVVRKQIVARNRRRTGLHLSENGLHSSWDWGNVHFINLNLYPGSTDKAGQSLDFVKDDLAHNLSKNGRPIVILHHYGFDPFSCEERWWTEQERETYYDAIKGFNVVAIFSGHNHAQSHRKWHDIDAYTAGRVSEANLLVVKVTPDKLIVAARSNDQWVTCWTTPLSP